MCPHLAGSDGMVSSQRSGDDDGGQGGTVEAGLPVPRARLQESHHDGHFTTLKFTTNWRVAFGTPVDYLDYRDAIAGERLAQPILSVQEINLEVAPSSSAL